MKGVYVLDLDNGHVFIMIANDVQEARDQLPLYLAELNMELHRNARFDGSYHYYPIMTTETDIEAEKRVFLITAKHYGIGVILARAEIRDSIGKGTWCSGFQSHLVKTLYGSTGNLEDSSSISVTSIGGADKDVVFSMSI